MKRIWVWIASIGLVSIAACKEDDNKPNPGAGCDLTAPDCGEGMVCEETADADAQCAYPLIIRGKVLDALDASAIGGATVQAVDPNDAAVGTSDVSAADGTFTLTVPARRDGDGAPSSAAYTLRAQAMGYEKFPSGIRLAVPIDATSAAREGNLWVIENALTDVALLPIEGNVETLGTISGTVEGDDCAGVLLVAENGDVAVTGYSDADCRYTIFNVEAGDYTVGSYAAGRQSESATTSVSEGEEKSGVTLSASADKTATVSGKVEIVNAPGGLTTSVVLALESTFRENVARGEVPPGLRATDVSGNFTIGGVPNGRYVVLAAFENDDLVRDPDESIGGTQIVHLEVPDPTSGLTIAIDDGFKVTEALAVVKPGADGPDEVTAATPEFEWADDSSEDGYVVTVYDAFGTEIWTDEIAGVSGDATVTATYGGPALEAGMYYQFRATSFKDTKDGRVSISATEDLRGVFVYAP